MDCPKCGYKNKSGAVMCAACYFDLQSSKKPVIAPVVVSSKARSAPPAAKPPESEFTPSNVGIPASSMPGMPATPNSIPQFDGSTQMLKYAGLWSRIAAAIVDGIILTIALLHITDRRGGWKLVLRIERNAVEFAELFVLCSSDACRVPLFYRLLRQPWCNTRQNGAGAENREDRWNADFGKYRRSARSCMVDTKHTGLCNFFHHLSDSGIYAEEAGDSRHGCRNSGD